MFKTSALLLILFTFSTSSFREVIGTETICKDYSARYEDKYAIPRGILQSISYIEAKQSPWTVGVKGKAHYFQDKTSAIAYVEQLVAQGVTNIDIGCMQINLFYHGKKFDSLEALFHPENNIDYAAKFLTAHFMQTNSWKHAIARYHSKTPSKGNFYAKLVLTNWKTVANIQ